MNKYFAVIFLVVLSFCGNAQETSSDSLPYTKFDNKLVLYSDFGYSTAPLSLSYQFTPEIDKLKFRNNFNAVIGFGFSYKWASLRFGITLPSSVRKKEKFGKTNYFDLGFDFSLKNIFVDVDLHYYQGYAIKNAYKWNDTITNKSENLIRNDVQAASLSFNAWQFLNKDFRFGAFRGKTSLYNRDIKSFYLKYTVNFHGIGTNNGKPLVPSELLDTNQSKTSASVLGAFDLGVVPGYAYVRRWRIFQAGIIGGLGIVIQTKYYTFENNTRTFLGLAPRIDLKFIAGINKPRYFVMFMGDFDNKSITFNNFNYHQTFYVLKLYAGIRLDVGKHKAKKQKS